jgi:Fur family ferric uptake transcriptional regulator
MDKQNTREILQKHNLVRTSCRQSIIGAILDAGTAVSEEEIKSKVEGSYDRTTFYRTFKTLIENGIIHKIVVDNHLVKYALSEPEKEDAEHIHFYCNDCGQVKCIEGEHVPQVVLPVGFKPVQTDLIVKGLCDKCSHD